MHCLILGGPKGEARLRPEDQPFVGDRATNVDDDSPL